MIAVMQGSERQHVLYSIDKLEARSGFVALVETSTHRWVAPVTRDVVETPHALCRRQLSAGRCGHLRALSRQGLQVREPGCQGSKRSVISTKWRARGGGIGSGSIGRAGRGASAGGRASARWLVTTDSLLRGGNQRLRELARAQSYAQLAPRSRGSECAERRSATALLIVEYALP